MLSGCFRRGARERQRVSSPELQKVPLMQQQVGWLLHRDSYRESLSEHVSPVCCSWDFVLNSCHSARKFWEILWPARGRAEGTRQRWGMVRDVKMAELRARVQLFQCCWCLRAPHESTCYSELFLTCQQTKMSNPLLEFHRPGPPLTSTEACRKRSPRGQYIGVNEKGIKQWVETVVGFWVCSPLGARCDLCTDLLLAAVREEILTLLNRIFFFPAAWSYSA